MGKFNFKNQEDFEKIKVEAETFYATLQDVFCPYFKEKIAFNVKGLKHLKFKSDRQARSHEDQYARLKLLHFASEALKKSYTVQGIWETKKFEAQKTNNHWEHILKEVKFYEFIAVLDNVRVKVIIKEVYGGQKHFWSVIPFWGIDKITSKRILHSGDPEHD